MIEETPELVDAKCLQKAFFEISEWKSLCDKYLHDISNLNEKLEQSNKDIECYKLLYHHANEKNDKQSRIIADLHMMLDMLPYAPPRDDGNENENKRVYYTIIHRFFHTIVRIGKTYYYE